jgi:hypothetical protein
MTKSAWYLYGSRKVTSRFSGELRAGNIPRKAKQLDVQGPCRVVVSIKGKFFKLASH